MKVTQEKLPASQIGLEIEIPSETTKQTYEKVFQNLSRTANIPGFRKGKVPRQILLQRLGTVRVKAAALEELIQDGLEKALKQESIEALGNYQLITSFEELIEQFKPGEPLTYKASVDVEPEVKLSGYKEISVKAEEVQPDASRVDKFLEERRSEQATLIPVEGRPAQRGDVAVVDYVLRVAGEDKEVEGGKATNYQIELVDGKFIPGFIEGVFGMNVGETKEVAVKFPDEYGREELEGKETVFTITLHELKEKDLPELNDEFAQDVSEFQTLEELRKSVEERYQADAEQQTKSNKEQALMAEILNHVEVDIPESLINREVDFMIRQAAMQLQSYGLDVNQLYNEQNMPQLRERSRPEAIERIKQSLALKEIAKLESLSVEATEVDKRIEELMQEMRGQQLDMIKLREFVSADIVREKALNWLTENANVELVPEGTLKKAETADETSEEAETEAETEQG
ncbi:trigger factor [Ancylothrix sp. C2]|uniref:trigger factor n=1 Tax=Ancylothrix sp. D3o TaxID=2953691 RepID=UPI0021BAE236|nr:trigger factor [Ancylothrix sp. D3o]MCT7951772.1 trigger factor [Ancylothrix sp. D3o]